jgi:beta-glucosidase/6-phospho-beta-glucosidase/beta-galactosidase
VRLNLLWLTLVALPLAACKTTAEPAADDGHALPAAMTSSFPDGFLWGTATAGFQVDMGCPSAPCTDDASDWYQWATDPDIKDEGLVVGDDPDDGPGFWELYAADFDRAKNELHNNAFRMSIEWSRIFPTSTEGIADPTDYAAMATLANAEAIAHYRDILQALHDRGMRPVVTLHHYSMPLWMHDGVECHYALLADRECEKGGWLQPERIVPEIAKYAGFAAHTFGDLVDEWLTQNEPFAVIIPGYMQPTPEERTNPPGVADLTLKRPMAVAKAMIEAHARMYDAVKAADKADADADGTVADVGIVLAMNPFRPENPRMPLDHTGAANANYIYQLLFLDAITRGAWDIDVDGVVDETRDDLKDRLDFMGINYYTRVSVKGLGTSFTDDVPVATFLPVVLWEYYPPGIYEMIMLVHERYGVPVMITENGTNRVGEAVFGPTFLLHHLAWVKQAIAEGADVRGYFYWSLVDNYEWNHGFGMQFGLYSFDRTTKARTINETGRFYGEIAEANAFDPAALRELGGEWLPPANPGAVPPPE